MKITKIICLSVLLSTTFILTGCVTNNTNTNIKNINQVVGTVNTSNVNEDENANTVVTNNNENLEDIDTSDWRTFSNQEMGFSFEYPLLSPITKFDYIECTGQEKCDGSITGKSYNWYFDDKQSDHYFIAGSSTLSYSAGRSLEIRDAIRFEQNNNEYSIILANNNSFKVDPINTIDTSLGKAIVYKIKDFPAYPELPENYHHDKIAIFNFNKAVNNFESASFYIYSSMSDADINQIINSIEIL